MDWLSKYDLIIDKIFLKQHHFSTIQNNTIEDCIHNYILYGKQVKNYISICENKIEIIDEKHIKIYLMMLLYCILKYNEIKHNKTFTQTYQECRSIFQKKNSDYGDSFVDFLGIGILVRLNDKINRTQNLFQNNLNINYESLDDTIIDSFNYIILALILFNDSLEKS
jgi:hypothetical protein